MGSPPWLSCIQTIIILCLVPKATEDLAHNQTHRHFSNFSKIGLTYIRSVGLVVNSMVGKSSDIQIQIRWNLQIQIQWFKKAQIQSKSKSDLFGDILEEVDLWIWNPQIQIHQ